MIQTNPEVPFVLRRLRLAWILSGLGLPQWDNVDGIAAEALSMGMHDEPLVALASLSQPIESALAMSLLDELATAFDWKKPQSHEGLFTIALFCAEEAVTSQVDALDACDYMYDPIYLRFEREGHMNLAAELQPFVEVSISWAENRHSMVEASSISDFRAQMVTKSLSLFQAFLDNRKQPGSVDFGMQPED
ncbi:hypothetical protein MB46_18585 [Arthrobacter alpinus]|uniref:hypothetical protein n=1 Tax=Arthrobacter alpinus TaxID=656366 RepID=UPI0005C8EC0A|nr:hypothetical protein [Arthrobacter alpinus]ALV47200.1 hypothetical protein MB46_18585 [Arthrobacter alpinus]